MYLPEGLHGDTIGRVIGVIDENSTIVAVCSYPGKLTASDYRTVFIDNTDNTTDSISHLMNYALK